MWVNNFSQVPDVLVRFWSLLVLDSLDSERPLLVRPLEKGDAGSGDLIFARNMQRTLFSIKIAK